MNLSAIGGFLVGLGAVLGLLPRLLWPAHPETGTTLGTFTRREERLGYAVETTGLAAAAAGSVVLAVANLADWTLELGAVSLAALTVWVLGAHKLRQFWLIRLEAAADDPNASPPIASAGQQRAFASRRTLWRWCLRHTFSRAESWPPPAARPGEPKPTVASPLTSIRPFEADKLERRDISELHAQDARLADLAIPPYVRADVAAMREQGFSIRVSGDAVIVVAPDGRSAQVSRSSVDRNSATSVAARQLFLRHCEAIGAELHVGARGQLHASGSIQWRLPDTGSQ